MSATALLRENPSPSDERDREGDPGQHLPLHGLLEHLQGGQGGVGPGGGRVSDDDGRRAARRRADRDEARVRRPERAAQGGQAARPGRGRLLRRRQAAQHGLRPLRPLAVRARQASARSTSRRRSSIRGVLGTLTGDEVALLTDPFFQISSPPGAHLKDFCLAVGKARFVGEPVAAVVATTRETRARRLRAGRGRLRAAAGADRCARGARRRRAAAARRGRDEPDLGGRLRVGRPRRRRSPRPTGSLKISELHFDRFNSTPLECNGALVEFNQGTGQWTIITNNQFPGFAAIMMGPAMRVGLDKLRFVTQDIGGGFGNKITSHPQLVALLPARPQAQPARAVDGVADRLPPLDVARQRALVPGHRGRGQGRRHAARLPDEGARRRGRVAALRAARRRHLGAGHARACTAGATSGSTSSRS